MSDGWSGAKAASVAAARATRNSDFLLRSGAHLECRPLRHSCPLGWWTVDPYTILYNVVRAPRG